MGFPLIVRWHLYFESAPGRYLKEQVWFVISSVRADSRTSTSAATGITKIRYHIDGLVQERRNSSALAGVGGAVRFLVVDTIG